MPFAVRTKNLKTPSLPGSPTWLSGHVNIWRRTGKRQLFSAAAFHGHSGVL